MKKFSVTFNDECLFLVNKQDKTFVIKSNNKLYSVCRSTNINVNNINDHC